MSVLKDFPTGETQSSTNRKGGRPKSPDPKVCVTLSIRRSTRDRIAAQLRGQTVAAALSAAVDRAAGRPDVTPRPKHAS